MGVYEHGYDDIPSQVRHRFALDLTIFNSGARIMIFQARLDTSDLNWVTDAHCDVTPRSKRVTMEAAREDVGWQISISPAAILSAPLDIAQASPDVHSPSPVAVEADSGTRLASVTHHTATAEQIPELIDLSLRARACHEHHGLARDGSHTLRVGIEHY